MNTNQYHDIVAIGASSGGVSALEQIAHALPAGLDAAVLIAQHVAPQVDTILPELLSARGPLHATIPRNGEPISKGQIYIAPSDRHMRVTDGHIEITRGPRENGHRPSIDELFRSASRAYGPRVIGVVLTGELDCGTAGLMSIKARGGATVAQDPTDAFAPSMPKSAIDRGSVDHVVPLAGIAPLLTKLVATPAPPPREVPAQILDIERGRKGDYAEVVCPECHGVLSLNVANGFDLFRCHEGHAFTLEALDKAQQDDVERALWAASRALDESAALARRVADRSQGVVRERFLEKATTQSRQAELVRGILLRGLRA